MRLIDRMTDSLIWKQKKYILLYIMIFIALIGTTKAVSMFYSYQDTQVAAEATVEANSYRLFVDGMDMGLIADRELGEQLIKKAMANLTAELGYDPEAKPTIRYYEEYAQEPIFAEDTALVAAIQNELKSGLDVIKVKAYAVKIGDDLILTLNSQEEVEQVLNNAKKRYISDDAMFDVNLDEVEYNTLILKPEIVLLQEPLADSKTLLTTAGDASEDVDAEEAVEELDPMYNGITTGAQFNEPVMVVETFVDESSIMTVDTATELITKEDEEPKVYTVVEGDCPSTIAEVNNMSLDKLYELNPEMENGSVLFIGDELKVMVPEPELSVSTTEEVVYEVSIPRETTYEDDPGMYVGSTKTKSSGSDGVMQITATLTKLNGNETSRTVTEELVLEEPVNMVVLKGTKPLPVKGSTGAFVLPVGSYTLSSSFGYRWGSFHYGVDLAAPTGTTIYAADGGTVIYAGWKQSLGYLIEIDHGDGVVTRYGHCSSIDVSEGQQVSQYEKIGEVGSTGRSTGPHCHFEIRFDGTAMNPMNYVD